MIDKWNEGAISCDKGVPAVVDFPTPPLPDATTMTSWTPGIGFCLGKPLAASFCRLSSNWAFDVLAPLIP